MKGQEPYQANGVNIMKREIGAALLYVAGIITAVAVLWTVAP